jgi:glycosyltransferase involved in cell wall biosynthesis
VKNKQALVSILIPNYNKAPYLRETLDSVLAQTYTNWECIIVDDHSVDNSWEILEDYAKKDSRFKIYRRPDHLPKGGNAARNYAFKMSNGEFVNWFDSDDLMNEEFLISKIDTLDKDQCLDFVISDIRVFNKSINNWYYYNNLDLSQKDINYPLRALIGDFWIGTPAPMFRRLFLNQFELFNSMLRRGQEAEFFNRILLSMPNFTFIPNSICFWRQDRGSKTSNFLNLSKYKKSMMELPVHILILKQFLNKKALDDEEVLFFNKLLNRHLRYHLIFSWNYLRLLYLIYFKYRQFPMTFPIKIIVRRIIGIENWA